MFRKTRSIERKRYNAKPAFASRSFNPTAVRWTEIEELETGGEIPAALQTTDNHRFDCLILAIEIQRDGEPAQDPPLVPTIRLDVVPRLRRTRMFESYEFRSERQFSFD
jgi:hypothetical protein